MYIHHFIFIFPGYNYATSTFPITYLICHSKLLCISIVFNFSWDRGNTQEKWKTKAMQNLAGEIRYIKGNEAVKWPAPSWLASWYWLKHCTGIAEVRVCMPASLKYFRHSFQISGFLNCDFLPCIIFISEHVQWYSHLITIRCTFHNLHKPVCSLYHSNRKGTRIYL